MSSLLFRSPLCQLETHLVWKRVQAKPVLKEPSILVLVLIGPYKLYYKQLSLYESFLSGKYDSSKYWYWVSVDRLTWK